MTGALIAAVLLVLLSPPGETAQDAAALVLNSNRVHLGVAGAPEWAQFAAQMPDARRLDLRFHSATNAHEATLLIRQDDVKQDWPIELNEKRIGKLFLMEADLVHLVPIPAGALRDGENLLSIIPPREKDDIVLYDIRVDPRPPANVLHEGTLEVNISDSARKTPLPGRLTIVNQDGTLAPFLALTNQATELNGRAPLMAARPGVVYTGNGRARLGLAAGDYVLYASRGFEWSVATQHVRVRAGQTLPLTMHLQREVQTPGLVSCDTHVHTFTHSGHGDASLEERMLTLAGEGLELPIATDHNIQIDYSEPARRLGMDRWFTPVTGNEVTTATGHFNIFPVAAGAGVPDFHITDWPRLMKELRATPGVRVVVLNHPRNVHNGFQPFAATNFNSATGENKRGPEFAFDAIELMNSSAQQTDYMLVYRDWFALLNYGYRVTGVGSSDGHDVSRYIVGQGRTYITCPDADFARIDKAAACSNLLAGRAFVSMGLLTQIFVDGKFVCGDLATGLSEQVRVSVKVSGPSWVQATNVALFANGLKIRETAIREATPWDSSSKVGEKTTLKWVIDRPAHDVHLVAIATGPAVTAPFWAIPRPYQPSSIQWESRVIGSTNPVWLDADGDARFTPARAYARRLVTRFRNPTELIRALKDFDEAVAVQAASLCARAAGQLEKKELARALKTGAPQVQRGFAAFAAAEQ
jgi:hypothetical protein